MCSAVATLDQSCVHNYQKLLDVTAVPWTVEPGQIGISEGTHDDEPKQTTAPTPRGEGGS